MKIIAVFLLAVMALVYVKPSLAFFHGVGAQSGKILRTNGTSFILRIDGVSKICRAGGC